MQTWRRAFPETEARFVCVCVDGRPEATARDFQRLYFDRDMVNAYIDSRDDFPRFQTQLGCQGLVVVDAEGRFATQRSPAFLDHRNAAFRVVEDALRALATRAAPAAAVGPVGGAAPREAARFAANACEEAPMSDSDDEDGFAFEAFPAVGHGKMDDDHAEIEALMRRALASRSARDARRLTEAFREHAAEEEALLRRAEDAAARSNGSDSTSPSSATPDALRASASHASDHARVLDALRAVVASIGAETHVMTRARGATVFSEKKVDGKVLARACRAVVEHAVTYDAAYAGKLTA